MSWMEVAGRKFDDQRVWSSHADPRLRKVVSLIHGPFIQWVCETYGFEDCHLVENLLNGFPVTGWLPACPYDSVPDSVHNKHPVPWSTDDLVSCRFELNCYVVGKVKSMEFEEDILSDTLLDAELGAMSDPVPWTGDSMNEVNVTRRIPVREERSKGWRTRVVDHETE